MSRPVNQPREEKSVLVSDVSCKVSIRNIRLVVRRNVAMVIHPTDRNDGGEGGGGGSTETFVLYLGEMVGTNLNCKQPRPIIYHFRNRENRIFLFQPALNMAQQCNLHLVL
jgi:hypothetical protein